MRIFLFAVSATIAAASPASSATRNFGITDFSKIRVTGPYKVNLETGVPPFAKAAGSPAALDRVMIEVRGDTLIVQADPSWGGYPGEDPGPVEISIGTHDLTNAALFGAGSLAIDRVKGLSFSLTLEGSGLGEIEKVASDQLTIALDGSASARLAGQANKLTARVRGVSTLDARKLGAHDAAISAEGTATIDANVTGTALVDGRGASTIRFSGGPSCAVRTSGSTSVSGCKLTR